MKRFLAVVLAVVLVGTAAAAEHIRSDGHGGFWNSDGSHTRSDSHGGYGTRTGVIQGVTITAVIGMSDGHGGYWEPDGRHVRSDGHGGFYR